MSPGIWSDQLMSGPDRGSAKLTHVVQGVEDQPETLDPLEIVAAFLDVSMSSMDVDA